MKSEIRVGADPEFEAWRGERFLSGEDILKIGRRGVLDYKAMNDGKIGIDGAGIQIEIRPKPAVYGWSVERRILRLAQNISNELNISLGVRGNLEPLGAHIHISSTNMHNIRYSKEMSYDIFCSALVRMYRTLIGEPTLELNSGARRNSCYGDLDDYRCQEYGNDIYGIEYRTPPSTVLCVRGLYSCMLELAILVLKFLEPLSKTEIYHLYDESKSLSSYNDCMKMVGASPELQEQYKKLLGKAYKMKDDEEDPLFISVPERN